MGEAFYFIKNITIKTYPTIRREYTINENLRKDMRKIPAAIVSGSPINGAQAMNKLYVPYFRTYRIAFLPFLLFLILGIRGLPISLPIQ